VPMLPFEEAGGGAKGDVLYVHFFFSIFLKNIKFPYISKCYINCFFFFYSSRS